MRLILAGSETGAALPAALAARHTVGGLARTPADLAGLWRRERPEAVVLVDAAAPPEAWVAVVRELLIPAVVVTPAHWDVTPWRGLAAQGVQVYAAGTPWATVWAALPAGETTPGAAAAETGPAPAAPAVSAAPPPPAPAPVGVPAVSATLAGAGVVLYPVVGGVGSSTLAVTLAATVAALGVKTLLATGDPWFLAGHWQFPLASRDEARAMSAALTGWVGGTGPAPVSADTLVVGDAWRGSVPVGLGALPVVLVARATSAAAWAAVAAGGELRRAGRALLGGVLVTPGAGAAGEFQQQTAAHGLALAWTELPYELAVPAETEVQGHALGAPGYGAAVERLARAWWPALPWPVVAEKGRRGGTERAPGAKPGRERRSWLSIEWQE